MIISGGFRTQVLTQQAPELLCDSCGHVGTIDFHVFSNCVHLFFIPLLPVGKAGHSTCRNCDSQIREIEMPSEMKRHFLAAKSAAHSPWWQFSGVGILGILLLSLPLIGKIVDTVEEEPVRVLDSEELSVAVEDGQPKDNPDEDKKENPYEDKQDEGIDY